QSIDTLGKDMVRVMDQLSGKVPFNLTDLGNQIFQQFNITGSIGNGAVAQIQTLVAEMGISGNAMDLWANISESLMSFGDDLVGGLRDFITAAGSVDLGAVFCNFTSAATGLFSQAGDFVGGLFSDVFEFRFDGELDVSSVWDTVADIFNSENFRFDFYQAADGLMRSISDGLSNLLDSGLNWVNDRWNEYYGQAEEYWNIIAGGPERWIEELQSGKWDSTINSLIDRYLPPEYQPAKSALTKIATIFDKDFTLDADFVIGFLDDLSAYLSEDVKGYYEDLKDYYDQGKEIYETTETVVNAISSGNIGSVVTNIQKLFGGLNLQFGTVYTWGGGRANKQGGYNNVGANLAFALQEQLDEYLASLPPEVRAEVERNLRGDYDRYDVGANLVFAQNEIDIADYAGGRHGDHDVGADPLVDHENVGANLVFARQDMTPAQLSPPRMAGPPMPPGCYWDVDTQTWVEYDKSVGADPPRSDTVGAHRVRPKKEDLTLMQKVGRVYKNTRPAGLAKNAAMAAGPAVIDASKKSAKYLGKKAGDAAYKTAKTAKKAADKIKESAEYLGKKTGDAAYKTAKTAKKAGKAAWKRTKNAAKATATVAKKAAKWGADKTKKSWDYLKNKTKKTVQTIGGKATAWHYEEREGRNVDLPLYEEIDGMLGWRPIRFGQTKYHQNGYGKPELKYIHIDGREVIYDGDTHEIVTDPRYKGTYNYCNTAKDPKPWHKIVVEWPTLAATYTNHFVFDMLPYYIGGNVRGEH
ncbi:hypothetical protein KAR34_04670, partial [bacterium]|nr:hypothetical protein [bacterium]